MTTRFARRVSNIAACLVLLLAVFQAAVVAIYNSPESNALKIASLQVLRTYSGPWLYQNWSLFAPAVAEYNNELFVRGKSRDGRLTKWLSVSQYYIIRGRNNPLFGEHYLSEALSHALDFAFAASPGDREASRAILLNSARRILCMYNAPAAPTEMELEIDRVFIPSIAPEKSQPHTIENKMLGWHPVICDSAPAD